MDMAESPVDPMAIINPISNAIYFLEKETMHVMKVLCEK
jgi:hypothetical protein